MKKEKLYDAKWFYKIKSIAKNGDTKKAERFLIEYMDKYPDDQYALTLFITFLIPCSSAVAVGIITLTSPGISNI